MATGVAGTDRVGDGALLREYGRGGDVRDECVGGDGTAGGISRRLVGDFEVRSARVPLLFAPGFTTGGT